MPVIEYTIKGKPQIKSVETFCSLMSNNLVSDGINYSDLLDSFDNSIMEKHKEVRPGALNKCHGDWYEWMLAATAWNYRIDHNKDFLLLLLPNVSSFDLSELYNDKLHGYILDLRSKMKASADVQLISSNPDFVLIDISKFGLSADFNVHLNTNITSFTPNSISILEKFYRHFIGKCSLEDIVGYLSVKTTLRPDRRLQIPHEGSLMKAIYVHLQTRDWIINPKGLKFYAAATSMTNPDKRALRTVATHSIIDVQSKPQAAVDDAFTINNNSDCYKALETMLSE